MGKPRGEENQLHAEVGVPLPVDKTFHYTIPHSLQPLCAVGKRVLVPFGKRIVTGYVLSIGGMSRSVNNKNIKEILDVLDETPLFDEDMLEFLKWTANHYMAPLGQVIRTALPPGLTAGTSGRVHLTQTGLDLRESSNTDRIPHADVLDAIDPQKGASVTTIINKLPRRSVLRQLERQGLISIEKSLTYPRANVKRQVIVHVIHVPLPREEARTPKQKTLLTFLEQQQSVTLAEIKRKSLYSPTLITRLQERNLITLTRDEILRNATPYTVERKEPTVTPTTEQHEAIERLLTALRSDRFHAFLLHGVAGSGKTEIYLRTAQEALRMGKSTLILVPEISLTPQLVGRFRRRLSTDIAVLHSGMPMGERYDQWRKIMRGDIHVIIGARSAVFAPCRKLGLIVVDEEHDVSFKQDEGVHYHARDLSVLKAMRNNAVVILGSATPSLESWHNCQRGKFEHLTLSTRPTGGSFPEIAVVDLKKERHRVITGTLRRAIRETLDRGEQSLIFLNRRGFSHSVVCTDCGAPLRCRRCSVTLTYHATQQSLLCHYCGYRVPARQLCPNCGGARFQLLGFGTERIEQEIQQIFPSARVGRMDSDVMSSRGAHAKVLQALDRGELDILIGTQMIVKGHDYPRITLMGIISADVTLNLPDLRASERAFQLLSQAAGRVGRADRPGKVVIQTFVPDHYVIQRVQNHDYEGFVHQEMNYRRELAYPPLTHMVNLRVAARHGDTAEMSARRLAAAAERIRRDTPFSVEILGPSPAPISQIKGRYRWQLVLKAEQITALQRFVRFLWQEERLPRNVKIAVDVDPVTLM
jgi:primosomal protein N' (replication factor Y)